MKKKIKLKDTIKTYILVFIITFSTLSLVYLCFNTADIDTLNKCTKKYGFEYCNKVVE